MGDYGLNYSSKSQRRLELKLEKLQVIVGLNKSILAEKLKILSTPQSIP